LDSKPASKRREINGMRGEIDGIISLLGVPVEAWAFAP
jgi:hypothetical protein